jgi:uncharacterized protein
MAVFESTRVRRLVGRLDRGDNLPEALVALARTHEVTAAWVRGLGALEWVELCEYDQHTQRYRPGKRIDRPCELLSLEGNLSMKGGEPFAHVHVTVSWESGDGIAVAGGHLVAAQVFACELSLECYDDLHLAREWDAATGLSLWADEGASDGAPSETPEPTGISWSHVAAVSSQPPPEPRVTTARTGRRRGHVPTGKLPPAPRPQPLPERRRMSEDEFLEERQPERGDFIEHRQFGLCRVDGEDAEGGLLIRLPSGVRKVIRLEMLRVEAPRHQDGRRIFSVRPRTRR